MDHKIKSLLIGVALFVILSPGMVLTLPPKDGSTKGLGGYGVLFTEETTYLSIFVHTMVFAGLFGLYLFA